MADWLSHAVTALAAIGGGQGLGAALTALRERSRKSSPGTVPPAPRLPQVSFPDLNDELHQIRKELHEQIESVRDDCDRGREQLALRQDKHMEVLTSQLLALTKEIQHALGAAAAAERERERERIARESRRGGPR